jgi:hypothetical protein
MPSPPTQQRQSTSNKFRAQPFVNHFADVAVGPVGEPSDGGERLRQGPLPMMMSGFEEEDEEHNVDVDVDVGNMLQIRELSRRVSLSTGSGTARNSFSHVGPPSISDIQRASIASSASASTISSARRSSYDPNEPGVLEKIHTGQGKSKRKPIAVQQWTMMNTFKIRPVATEAPPIPIPLSVAPDRPLPSSSAQSPVEDEAFVVFVADPSSALPIHHSPPVPRAVPIVIPPSTLQPPSIPPRSPRKRPRYVFI